MAYHDRCSEAEGDGSTRGRSLVMAPKPKSIAKYVDGVHYILNISSRLVVVGTGLVANAERDTFKLKVSPESPSLEEQVRARPKFAMFAVAAAASSNTLHPPSQPPQTSSSGQPLPPTYHSNRLSRLRRRARRANLPPTPSASNSLSRLRQLPRPPNLPRQLNHPWSRSLSGVACLLAKSVLSRVL